MRGPLRLADRREAAGLAAFLSRLLRFDRAAVVRLRTAGRTLAVFGRVPLGDPAPLAVRPARLAAEEPLDATLSAGQLLDALASAEAAPLAAVGGAGLLLPAGPAREDAGAAGTAFAAGGAAGARGAVPADGLGGEVGQGAEVEVRLPAGVTGPAWAGLLPPRAGWQSVGRLPADAVAAAVAAGVAEFRGRMAEPGADADAVAEAIWSRPLGPLGGLPLRAAHAAQVLGFLGSGRPPGGGRSEGAGGAPRERAAEEQLSIHRHQAWLRLSTPGGSIALRRAAAPGAGLGLTPLR